jgi:hypothetical protein
MFEAKLLEGGILKKVLDAIKDLLTEATFDCKERSASFNFSSYDDACTIFNSI